MNGLVLHLPVRLRTRLEAEAQRLGRTPEQFAKDALTERLKPTRRPRDRSLFERSRDLRGRLRGGPVDLARNKDHMEGYGRSKQ